MNTQFQQLYDDVMLLTNRLDLVEETKKAVKMATMKAHKYDEFPQDKVVAYLVPVVNTDTGYLELDTTAVDFVRYRKMLNISPTPATFNYERTSIGDMFGAYGLAKTNVFYTAGTTVIVKASVRPEKLQCVYLTFPDVREASYSSWIATRDSDAIVSGAASIIMDITGKRDETVRMYKLFNLGLAELQADCVEVY